MDNIYDFGELLQRLRKERGLTQAQLAKLIHKESSIISRYEKNLQSPTFETVRSFAAIFNVSMDYLSGMEKNNQIYTYGLDNSQVEMISELVEALRVKNTTSKININKQYELIGKIVTKLVK